MKVAVEVRGCVGKSCGIGGSGSGITLGLNDTKIGLKQIYLLISIEEMAALEASRVEDVSGGGMAAWYILGVRIIRHSIRHSI